MNRISLIGFTIVVVGAIYIQAFNAGEDAMRAFLSSNVSKVGLEGRSSETVS
jgi:hypothetical protein